MRRGRIILMNIAAASLAMNFAFAQPGAPPSQPPAVSGSTSGPGFPGRAGDPKRCAAPTGMGAANYKSAE
jgi:hypothetical protein